MIANMIKMLARRCQCACVIDQEEQRKVIAPFRSTNWHTIFVYVQSVKVWPFNNVAAAFVADITQWCQLSGCDACPRTEVRQVCTTNEGSKGGDSGE